MENHAWIAQGLDDEEMEAVLVVTNELPAWESAAIVRAFQTYLWSSAGNTDQASFVHDDSGVIVSYDGNVLGIECGHGSLQDALPDLLSVLSSLGWSGATVYALQATLSQIMDDLARSIPANVDFELDVGQRGMPMSELPEAQNIMDHSRRLLREAGSDAGDEDSRAMFQSLASASSITLLDDEAAASDEVLHVGAPKAHSEDSIETTRLGASLDHGAPAVFELPSTSGPIAAPVAAEAKPALSAPRLEPAQPTPPAKPTEPAKPLTVAPAPPVTSNRPTHISERFVPSGDHEAGEQTIVVGRSVFCFDPVSNDALQQIAQSNRISPRNVIHLFPGAKAPAWRWDLLAEVDESYPASGTALASWAFHRNELLELSPVDHDLDTTLIEVSREGGDLVKVLEKSDSPAAKALKAQLNVYGGKSFFDANAEGAGTEFQSFSVRQTMQQHHAHLYVVHVDSLDGPFVEWVMSLLRTVARAYSTSAWFASTLEPAPAVEEPMAVKELNIAPEALQTIGALLATLQEAGITIPIPAAA